MARTTYRQRIRLGHRADLRLILVAAPLLALAGLAPSAAAQPVPVYGYQVLHVYPHDRNAYTEGLIVSNDVLYESTGLWGSSSLRKVDLQTGTILKNHDLPAAYFGEGIAVFADSLYQLTWQNHVGLTYVERDSFHLVYSFDYPWEGWGLTEDSAQLIASDGTATIRYLDPSTRTVVSQIQVAEGTTPINYLNELEYVRGRIYSNVWGSDRIAVINPGSGQVEAWLDLGGLRDSVSYYPQSEVLNGIAFDPATNRLFVTGKFWPKLFEIDVPTLHTTGVGHGALTSPRLRVAPNPCREETLLSYTLPGGAPASLLLFDTQGRLVRTLFEGRPASGDHVIHLGFHGLPSGTYFASLSSGGRIDTRRILVVR